MAQVIWENEKETTEEMAENRVSLSKHRAARRACEAYNEYVQGQHNKTKGHKMRRKRDTQYSRLNDTRKDIQECKSKEQYLQTFLDKEPLEELEKIRSQDDLPDSDNDTDSKSSNSSHGDASGRSSFLSEADKTTQDVETEEVPTGKAAFDPQVEADQATEEDAAMEEDFHDETMGDIPPLSLATPTDSELLDQMEWTDPRPPATPNRVTDGISGLQINSPHSEAETLDQQDQ